MPTEQDKARAVPQAWIDRAMQIETAARDLVSHVTDAMQRAEEGRGRFYAANIVQCDAAVEQVLRSIDTPEPALSLAYANTAQGEDEDRAAVLIAALESDYRPKVGEGDYDYLALAALPKALREQAKDALFFEAEPHVTIDAWNIVQMAADELEAALAKQPEGQTAGSGVREAEK